MSDVAIGRAERGQVFQPATIGLMILVGVVGFFGSLVLGTYAPQLESQGKPGPHALSRSAVGFSGLVQLAAGTGRNPHILRDERAWAGDELVVVTPPDAATNLGKIIALRGMGKPTLYVLPKWDVEESNSHKGWVQVKALLPAFEPEGVLAPGIRFSVTRHVKLVPALHRADGLPQAIAFSVPEKLQVIVPSDQRANEADKPPPTATTRESSAAPDQKRSVLSNGTYEDIQPLITDGSGGIVLGEVGNLFILADPDLLDNAGMKRMNNARAALALLDWMNATGAKSIGFDVVLDGLGSSKSLLRLAFDPPFLAMTLALAVMVVLLGIRAAGRFGAPRPRVRAIAFGKTALVDNGALLVRKAGKARLLGGRYVAVIRDQAIRTFGVSPRFSPAETDQYLDRLGGAVPFTRLAEAAEAANDEGGMLMAARALHAWKREIVGDD